jgi:hypothetical protein
VWAYPVPTFLGGVFNMDESEAQVKGGFILADVCIGIMTTSLPMMYDHAMITHRAEDSPSFPIT